MPGRTGPLVGWTRRVTPVGLRRLRCGAPPMSGIRCALWPVRSCVAGGFMSLSRLLRQGLPPDAQQRDQRDENTDQNQSATVSHGITQQATSGVSGRKRPVVILHYPQLRHMLQRPADHEAHPGRHDVVLRTTNLCRSIRGFLERFVNIFQIAAHFFAPISTHLLHLVLAPGLR
jgi:hypothetical protein